MEDRFIALTDEGMKFFDGSRVSDMSSTTLAGYIARARQIEHSREWKSSGAGAAFLGEINLESRSADKIRSRISCTGIHRGKLLYSLWFDEFGGIYTKLSPDDENEGSFWSDSSGRVCHFDVTADRPDVLVASVSYGREIHIALYDIKENDMRQITEGESIEEWPSFSRQDGKYIYYGSRGMARSVENEERPVGIYMLLMQNASSALLGPSAIYRMNTESYEIDELLSDPDCNFEKPYHAPSGTLYFIKRPYGEKKGAKTKISDAVKAPGRFLGAVGGFLNLFTMKYSGQTLTSSGGQRAKNRSEYDRAIDGNLINSEKELQANRAYGDKNPGIVPHSFEFCCTDASAKGGIRVLKKGVIAFAPIPGTEDFYISNGSSILRLYADGREENICKLDGAFQIIPA